MGLSQVRKKLPNSFLDMLYELYSMGTVDEILRSYQEGRKTTVRINTLKVTANEILNEFRKNGIKFSNCNMINNAFIILNSKEGNIEKLPSYNEGKIYLQNLSSMLPPLFLDLEENMSILDMCAAPGSKTTQMAAMINNKGKIIANELNQLRRERLMFNIKKQDASCVAVIGHDGRKLGGLFKEKFDRVLLDAPCSGEGTIYIKKPKSYRGICEKTVNNNSKLQKSLLKSGLNALKPRGILVYSTCTLSPEENEEVVHEIISENNKLSIVDIDFRYNNVLNGVIKYKNKMFHKDVKKAIRITPNKYMEGFFLCKIQKIS